ncbi:MAG: nuclear transport factor 2 family protein [Hyphomicrobiales bacterium]|nr:nuclear transport factor 2 family protein [Hyphomicrobiales bacterium]
MEFQTEKQLIRDYYTALDSSDPDSIGNILDQFVSSEYLWRGFHPFNQQVGPKAVSEQFWKPLRQSLTSFQRRIDVFMAGGNQIDDFKSVWVTSMGHLVGLFDEPWLGIPATGKMAFLRYCEFNRVEDGKITETAMFFDIPHLMIQAGLCPFPQQTASHLVQPGPATHDGLLFDVQNPSEGEDTLTAINNMINDIKTWTGGRTEPLEVELARSWNDDMIWWGPAGIGATCTIERYARQHSGPFRATFKDRQFNGHLCKIAEGKYGGFFGWPNLTLTPTGPYMGIETQSMPVDMRVIDIYRRDGDKLAENWIFIDFLHFWIQLGVDILKQAIPGAVR